MAKTLRVRTRAGWITKPAENIPDNRLSAAEVDDTFLALEDQITELIQNDIAQVLIKQHVDGDYVGFVTKVDAQQLITGLIPSTIVTFVRQSWDGVQYNYDDTFQETIVFNGTSFVVQNETGSDPSVIQIDGSLLVRANTWQFAQAQRRVVLTDAASIAIDASYANKYSLDLGALADRTVENPTNLADGQDITIRLKQHTDGSKTVTFGTKWAFPGGTYTMSAAPNAVDVIAGYYDSDLDKILITTVAQGIA